MMCCYGRSAFTRPRLYNYVFDTFVFRLVCNATLIGIEQPASFYDENLANFLLPLAESPWLKVYQEALSKLPEDKSIRILDIGCGTGRMARLAVDNGYANYTGVDFSPARVEEARRYVPEADFAVSNVLDPAGWAGFSHYDTFILLEVLEHLGDELSLLRAIPEGATVLLSVPNYDAKAHVRFFRSLEDIRGRYDGVLNFFDDDCTQLGHGNVRLERYIWVIRAVRCG